jgi:VanZ family protein
MSTNDQPIAAKRISLAVLVVYWIALFAATHVPAVHPPLALVHADKMAHAGMYAVLALLLAVAWSQRAWVSWRAILAVFALLAIYGVLDEVTQPMVGRSADVLDWLADMAGAIGGLAIFVAARGLRQRTA